VLAYVLAEVFKNACRAVVERHDTKYEDALPPVRCQVEHGAEDVVLRINDEGGGMSLADSEKVWHFMYSTSGSSPWDDTMKKFVSGRLGQVNTFAGYGIGLPMSRSYARHFGGDLVISSAQGSGTEVCMRLGRRGLRRGGPPKTMGEL